MFIERHITKPNELCFEISSRNISTLSQKERKEFKFLQGQEEEEEEERKARTNQVLSC